MQATPATLAMSHRTRGYIARMPTRPRATHTFTFHALTIKTTLLPKTKQHKTQSLEDILLKFGPITDVSYEPFQCEPRQAARAVLLPSFPRNPHPFDYFSLFFTHDLFCTITTNTNRYAGIQRLRVLQEKAREWTDLLIEELYVFLGVIIYIGIHEEPAIKMY